MKGEMEVLVLRSAEAARSKLDELPRLALLPRSVVGGRSSELVRRTLEGLTWEGIAVATAVVGEVAVEREGEEGDCEETSLSFEGSRFLDPFIALRFGDGASRVEEGE